MEVSVVLPTGVAEGFAIKSFDTAKDLVKQALENYTPEERSKFQLVEFKKGRDGVSLERPLNEATVISQLKTNWQADKDHVYSLVLVRLDNEVVVNFNTYFRMMAGVSQTKASFSISDSTTVGMLNDKIKLHLKLPASEQRFGLMGFYGAGKEMRKLSKEEKIVSLKSAYETPENTFFQFQVLPEMEDKKHLGADKEGYLEVYQKMPPLWKKRWCSLRGDCLFIFKEKGEHDAVVQIPRLNEAKIIPVGSAKKKGLGQKNGFRIEIEAGGNEYALAAEDQQSMLTWVEAIKSCGSRNDARAATVVSASVPQRTFVPIAAKNGELTPEQKQISENEQQDKMLESIKKCAESLAQARGTTMVASTKSLVTETQTFTVAISKKIDSSTPKTKSEKMNEYIEKIKSTLKQIIPAAKSVGVLSSDVDNSAELRLLKKETQNLVDACEILLITLRMEEDELILEEKKVEEVKITSTGNTELDSIVSGLNMFGISPELAEMMKLASAMPNDEDPLAAYSAPSTASSSSAYSSKTYANDDPLDSILQGLNSALDGLDVPLSKPSADYDWSTESSGDRCSLCMGEIQGRTVKGLQRTWHPDCYYCTQCGTNLEKHDQEQIFSGPQGMPYCKKDFLPLCPKCPLCTNPVLPKEAFHAFDKVFHNKCFRCQNCGNTIEGPSFEVTGKPFCETCFHQSQGTICAECYKPIYGSAITVVGKKRHPHCFVCSFCKKTLTKETGKAREEKLYCAQCIAQLFG